MRQNIAPMIILLNKISLSESNSETYALPSHTDAGDSKVSSLVQNTLHLQITKNTLVQRIRRKCMCLVNLKHIGDIIIRRRKSGPDGWAVGVQSCSIEISVEPILAEILVNAHIPLQRISNSAGIKNAVINHRCAARQIRCSHSSTSSGENVRGSLRDAGHGCTARSIVGKQAGTHSIRKILFGP